jgi:hypothetical protein
VHEARPVSGADDGVKRGVVPDTFPPITSSGRLGDSSQLFFFMQHHGKQLQL